MSLSTTSRVEDNYLLIESSGVVNNAGDEKLLTFQCYEEIAKTDIKRIVLDHRKVEFRASITDMFVVVSDYSTDFPTELRSRRIASVVAPEYKELCMFWETCALNRGYNFRLFTDFESALEFLLE